jgi:MFS family permease
MISDKLLNHEEDGNRMPVFLNTVKFSMKKYTVALFSLTLFFLFADQNLLAPNLDQVADEFDMSDHERDRKLGGDIALGFFLVGAPVALLVGYMADIVKRNILFSLVVVFGSICALCTYWAKTYSELFACRILTGIGIGGATPIVFSVLGDLYPDTSRVYVATMVGIAQAAGIACGQFMSGMVGPTAGWRVPFVITAVPSLLCGILVGFTVEEPKRGEQEKAVKEFEHDNHLIHKSYSQDTANSSNSSDNEESNKSGPAKSPLTKRHSSSSVKTPPNGSSLSHQNEKAENILSSPVDSSVKGEDRESSEKLGKPANTFVYSEKIEWDKVINVLKTPSALIIFIQGFPGCVPWGMIYTFMNNYLSDERGMSTASATGIVTCFALAGLLGQLFGGYAGQNLYNTDPRAQILLMGITTMLSVGPVIYLINAPMAHGNSAILFSYYLMAFLGGFIVNMNGPNIRVVLQVVSRLSTHYFLLKYRYFCF